MPNLDKYLQMLASPKSGTRYDACEELRVSNESSEQIVLALEKLTQDSDHQVADAARKALAADVHRAVLRKMGGDVPKSPVEIRQDQAKAIAAITIVTTPTIEGYRVTEYLGLVSAEVVLGTGFLSELGAGLSDLLGTRAEKFQRKLKEAKEVALRELRTRAFELHGNAILGVDLDYSVLADNLLMVVANGTVAKIEPIRSQ